MLKTVEVGTSILLLYASLWSQVGFRPKFFDKALIRHQNAIVVVTANYPLPLYQALAAIDGEYGWRINWESAPGYSHYDLVDDTAPKWRLAHPDAKGVTRPSGGLFTTSFREPRDSSLATEEAVLQKIISDYNNTDNPGRYTLRVEPKEPLTVVGSGVRDDAGHIRAITPLLDMQLTVPRATRSVQDTVALILSMLQASSGVRVIQWTAGTFFNQVPVTLGGTPASARNLLRQALAATGRPVQYALFYNADRQEYQFSITLAVKAVSEGSGAYRLVPTDRLPKP